MHEQDVKGILSPTNGMNLFRGCTHGCIYCDSRSKCYHMDHDFEDIEVKRNAAELLEHSLKHKRKKCMIGTGAMTDPYLPEELELGQTRRCLELIEKYGFGLAIQTKSDRLLRDIDLLEQINRNAKCVVQMTLTTYDETLCGIVEPNVCTTARRVEVLHLLRERGIPTVVWISPILPFINDTRENLRGLLAGCVSAGVYGILCFGMGLTLREGNRDYFYQKLDEHFPGLKERYQQKYRDSYEVRSDHHHELMRLLREECRKNRIVCDNNAIFSYLHELEEKPAFEQLSLFEG